MSDRRRATQLEDLPKEIVVDQILIRLPSKDVGRCRAVSTSWRSATSTPEFMLQHRRRQPSLPIIHGGWKPASYVVLRDAGAAASSQNLWPFFPGSKQEIYLCASCDGFLIVKHVTRLYICNPVIRTHALLPLPLSAQGLINKVIGFYCHRPTQEYRVLLVSESKNCPKKYSLHNLTVGSDELRHVTVTMPAVSSPSVEQKLLRWLRGYCLPPVQHRGSLHWGSNDGSDITEGGGDIIVFHTETESFHWMQSPTPTQNCFSRKLFSMKGTLYFWGSLTRAFTAINVWVMQDYDAGIWAFKCRIDLSTVEASRQLYKTSLNNERRRETPLDSEVEVFNDMALLNERELLILFNYKHVLRCDIDGNFLGIVNIGNCQYRMLLTQHRFQESIIPIPYHETQEEDEESLFSAGHV